MYLPEKYLNKMQELLGSEYEAFLTSYDAARVQGLRINTLKISVEKFLKISPFSLKPIPWCKEGFYFEEGERPAKHPYYHAGLYYIQEPSAMAPVSVLSPQPGERVADICAAPGGKTVQIASALMNQGILIANDIHFHRVKALIKNIELFGIKNTIVTNECPEKLTSYFSDYFDKILVDAPCSGEGMFRKDAALVKSWETHDGTYYAPIQRNILKHVIPMLRARGRLLYSTCTFSPEENEGIVQEFIKKNDEFHLVNISKVHGIAGGRPEWIDHGSGELKKCARLWPHKLQGEGHFLALLERISPFQSHTFQRKNISFRPPKEFYEFVEENLNIVIEGIFEMHHDHLYLVPAELPDLKGLKVVRSGWFLGTYKKNRFEPSHAMAMALTCKDAKRVVNFCRNDKEVIKYLKGDTLNIKGEKGWTLICVEDYPLGWAKQTGSILKNHYPPAWRWLD